MCDDKGYEVTERMVLFSEWKRVSDQRDYYKSRLSSLIQVLERMGLRPIEDGDKNIIGLYLDEDGDEIA